jgi:hypothetical protein
MTASLLLLLLLLLLPVGAVAHKEGAVPTLVACCRDLQQRAEGDAAADAGSSLVQVGQGLRL